LERRGVEVRVSTMVVDVEQDAVVVESAGVRERISSRTVLWAAGVRASPLGAALAEATGAETDRAGRVKVRPDLTLPDRPEVFVIGDLAGLVQDGKPLPGVAPVAMQQGRYAAEMIRARLEGKSAGPFRYRDYGNMATIGRSAAVAEFGPLRLWGFPGWVTWLIVHLMKLTRFENRLLVMVQWAWNYFTRNRSSLLITGEAAREAVRLP
jgi:NADH dehydrogenase